MIRRRFMRAGRDPDAPAPIPLSISDLSPWSDEPQGDGISHLPSHTSLVEVAGHQSWGADTGGRPTPRDETPGRTRFGNRSPGTRRRRDASGPAAEPTGDPRPRAAARAFDALALHIRQRSECTPSSCDHGGFISGVGSIQRAGRDAVGPDSRRSAFQSGAFGRSGLGFPRALALP